MTREEYLELAQLLRPRVAQSLGVRPIASGIFDASLLTVGVRLPYAHVLRRCSPLSRSLRPS